MPKRKHFQTVTVEREVPARKLANAVTARFLADFKRHGIATIERVREESPAEYLRIITKLLPRQLDVGVQHSFSDVLLAAAEQIRSEQPEQLSHCSVTDFHDQAMIVQEGPGTDHGEGADGVPYACE